MLLNLVLLFLVFGAEKKKKNPYLAALLLGLIKAIIYAVFSRNLIVTIFMGCAYGALAAAFVYFLKRLDRRDKVETKEVSAYRSFGSEKMTFQWEYLPLVILLGLLLGGEILLQ